MVAKAQQAAADAAQRSDEEAARVRRELEILKKEKRGLVQRCTSAERDLAAAVVRMLCWPSCAVTKHASTATMQKIMKRTAETLMCSGLSPSAYVPLHISGLSMLVLLMAPPADMNIHAKQVAVTPLVIRPNNAHENSLVIQQVSQEQMQQQLTQFRAASKASDSSKAQAVVQHQAQLAELHQQLGTAKQHIADLHAQHQQDLQQQLASAAAATADIHKHEMETLRSEYAASCHQQAAAMKTLQQEAALLTQETERDMTTVVQKMSALHGASYSSQAELQQQLQQLRAQIAALQNDSTSVGNGGGMQEAFHALMSIRNQLDAEGYASIGPLLQKHQQLQTQVSCDSPTSTLTGHSACNSVWWSVLVVPGQPMGGFLEPFANA